MHDPHIVVEQLLTLDNLISTNTYGPATRSECDLKAQALEAEPLPECVQQRTTWVAEARGMDVASSLGLRSWRQ